MDILDKLDLLATDDLNEIFKKVIRAGKVKRKLICPIETMKAQNGKCVLMGPEERRKRNKAAIKRGRKFSANLGLQKKAEKKRKKSMRKRENQIADTNVS